MIRSDLDGERDGTLAVGGTGGDREFTDAAWDEDDREADCAREARRGNTTEAGEGA